ncbi:head GIN domain-containing protein [uncultured Sphingomonas sp.]|uniref:head GIN domain-containing protein n=1 Tax=uncultured Sphingomonas sp. TaxID=158754 RepID=UPI0025FF9439|nr:head GIN domain-containing protein [uncultured Sphingomonas sp.]
MRFLMVLAALPLAACGIANGSNKGDPAPETGSGTARSFQVADFSKVELAGADDVDVRVGPAFSVRAEGPADQLDKLDIRRDGSTLLVGRKREKGWSISRGKGVKVYVTMPAIEGASLAGSGNMSIDTARTKTFEASLAGSGNLRLARVDAEGIEVDLAGSGNVDAAGQVGKLDVNIAGSGNVQAARLKAAEAEISIAGSGNVAAEVSRSAKVSVMGSGDVTLTGGARCDSTKMGSGDIRCS